MPLWRRLLDALLRPFGFGGGPIPREPVSMRPIGVVRNAERELSSQDWREVRSDLIFRDDLMGALDGLETWSHIIVVCAFNRLPEEHLGKTHIVPMDDPRNPVQGILATRSQLRPNPIGVSVVSLLRRRRNILRVKGLDAIDGTLILDVKPYIPGYDDVSDARVPDWLAQRRKESEEPPQES
jgi:tRNA-Thr(GGU) m(6)t(6)A37 methyltransferase TsaA